jgi:hypothetical protein
MSASCIQLTCGQHSFAKGEDMASVYYAARMYACRGSLSYRMIATADTAVVNTALPTELTDSRKVRQGSGCVAFIGSIDAPMLLLNKLKKTRDFVLYLE